MPSPGLGEREGGGLGLSAVPFLRGQDPLISGERPAPALTALYEGFCSGSHSLKPIGLQLVEFSGLSKGSPFFR